jgi:hypothetical protein
MDAQSLSLLLDIELACAFIVRFSSVPPLQGVQHWAQPDGALEEILHRIAVALARLSSSDTGARDLLSRAELDTIKALARRGAKAAAKDAARRVLLAAVPRLLFETQAVLAENREPWVINAGEGGCAGEPGGFPILIHRAHPTRKPAGH